MSWQWVSLADATPFQIIMDYTGTPGGGPVYVGWAPPGVTPSQDKWKIIKISYVTISVNGVSMVVESQRQFANGDVGFHQVFNTSGGTTYNGNATFK
jgi:hypothetical protein